MPQKKEEELKKYKLCNFCYGTQKIIIKGIFLKCHACCGSHKDSIAIENEKIDASESKGGDKSDKL